MNNFFKLVSLTVVMAALVGGVYLVRNNQQLQKGATQAETSSQVLPSNITVASGSNFTVSLWVNTGRSEDKLTAMEMTVSYDPAKMKFLLFTPMSGYTLVNDANSLDNGSGKIKLSLVAMGPEMGGAINYGVMSFAAITGSGTIAAGRPGNLMINGQSSTWTIASGQNSMITITGNTPVVSCIPRPPCLDSKPKCAMPERSDYCPKSTVLGKLGDACGLNMTTGKTLPDCGSGLVCKSLGKIFYSADGQIVGGSQGAGSVCVKAAKSGEVCNFRQSGQSILCESGLTCKQNVTKLTTASNGDWDGVCAKLASPSPTVVNSCGKRCTSDNMCGSGQTCAPIWWPCRTLPVNTKTKVQKDEALSPSEVSTMTTACPMTSSLAEAKKQSDGKVKMPLFYGVCRNTSCVSSVNCNCSTQIQPFGTL